ncbi:hypothetical protein J6590_041407 [Homalodisca vitripennis]|nr:hypothetical protein J6590_041407 [Homalodisca vitripennis]
MVLWCTNVEFVSVLAKPQSQFEVETRTLWNSLPDNIRIIEGQGLVAGRSVGVTGGGVRGVLVVRLIYFSLVDFPHLAKDAFKAPEVWSRLMQGVFNPVNTKCFKFPLTPAYHLVKHIASCPPPGGHYTAFRPIISRPRCIIHDYMQGVFNPVNTKCFKFSLSPAYHLVKHIASCPPPGGHYTAFRPISSRPRCIIHDYMQGVFNPVNTNSRPRCIIHDYMQGVFNAVNTKCFKFSLTPAYHLVKHIASCPPPGGHYTAFRPISSRPRCIIHDYMQGVFNPINTKCFKFSLTPAYHLVKHIASCPPSGGHYTAFRPISSRPRCIIHGRVSHFVLMLNHFHKLKSFESMYDHHG